MIAHIGFSRNKNILVEASTGAINLGNHHVLSTSTFYNPCCSVTRLKVIFDYLVLLNDSKRPNKPLTILVSKIFYVALSEILS
jgi:hypothetical protein